jgi:hypothetical protein
MLEITKVSEDLYLATATPPEVNEAWSTQKPISAHRLLKQLIDVRGGHSSDVGAALYAADPEWVAKAQGPYE